MWTGWFFTKSKYINATFLYFAPIFFLELLNAWWSNPSCHPDRCCCNKLVCITRKYLQRPSHGGAPAWPCSSSGATPDCSWVGRCSHSMASGTLERCSLHGWIPVFAPQGRWRMAWMEGTNIPCEANGWSHQILTGFLRQFEITRQLVWKTKQKTRRITTFHCFRSGKLPDDIRRLWRAWKIYQVHHWAMAKDLL